MGRSSAAFAGANDFHLTTASPAVNSGALLPEVALDYDGCVRPQGGAQDMGAFER